VLDVVGGCAEQCTQKERSSRKVMNGQTRSIKFFNHW
jgi:hypothetical protein